MLKRNFVLVSLLLICFLVVCPLYAQAAPVGNFIQVEGPVDILKGGKIPGVPVKVQEAVDVGDVVRTKTQSRAQIKFVDETVLTIAPESRITIEDYMFDAARGERQAVVGVLKGLVHTAVGKVYPKAEPDFIMKTHTAVLGVRGTKWYTKLLPTATEVYTEADRGTKLEVRNILPEITGVQTMGPLQYLRVDMYFPPTVPMNITIDDLKPLQKQMTVGIGAFLGAGPLQVTGPVGPPLFPKYSGERTQVENLGSGLYVPPRIAIPPVPPPVQTPVTPQPSHIDSGSGSGNISPGGP